MNTDWLAKFDLIDKADGVVRDIWFTLRGRGCAVIAFSAGNQSPREIEAMLHRRGVPVWGRELVGKEQMGDMEVQVVSMHVPAKQRNVAEYFIERAGGTVMNPVDPRNATWAAQHDGPAPAWADRKQWRDGSWASGRISSTRSRVISSSQSSARATRRSGKSSTGSSKNGAIRGWIRRMW
jgi:hypothetical protein